MASACLRGVGGAGRALTRSLSSVFTESTEPFASIDRTMFTRVPAHKPLAPSLRTAAAITPKTPCSACATPCACVASSCSRVLTKSRGLVTNAAIAPDAKPAPIFVEKGAGPGCACMSPMIGSCSPMRKTPLLSSRRMASPSPRCTPATPSAAHMRRTQSTVPAYFGLLPADCSSRSMLSRVFATSAGLVKSTARAGPTAEIARLVAATRRGLKSEAAMKQQQQQQSYAAARRGGGTPARRRHTRANTAFLCGINGGVDARTKAVLFSWLLACAGG